MPRKPGKQSVTDAAAEVAREVIVELRDQRYGGKLVDLAKAIEASGPALSQILSKTNKPSFVTVQKLAALANLDVGAFLKGERRHATANAALEKFHIPDLIAKIARTPRNSNDPEIGNFGRAGEWSELAVRQLSATAGYGGLTVPLKQLVAMGDTYQATITQNSLSEGSEEDYAAELAAEVARKKAAARGPAKLKAVK